MPTSHDILSSLTVPQRKAMGKVLVSYAKVAAQNAREIPGFPVAMTLDLAREIASQILEPTRDHAARNVAILRIAVRLPFWSTWLHGTDLVTARRAMVKLGDGCFIYGGPDGYLAKVDPIPYLTDAMRITE